MDGSPGALTLGQPGLRASRQACGRLARAASGGGDSSCAVTLNPAPASRSDSRAGGTR